MVPSLWQHQTVEPAIVPVVHDMTAQAFASGVLVGIVVVATVLLWRPWRSRGRATRRRTAGVRGWGDLFRLVAGVARGVLWLMAGLLLLARVVCWPAGRRW